MVILVLLGGVLVASVPPTPDRGGIAPFVAMATGAVITLIRAWQLARSQGDLPVLTARRWKLILFVLLVVAFGCYAVWAVIVYGNAFVPGAFLMTTGLLIGTLLFEPHPLTDRGNQVPLHGASE
jgi:hypothetical protein